LQARKGHAQLVAALPRIIERVPDALYAIVGEGETRPQLESLIASLGLAEHVRLMGELRDEALVGAMQQCDLFALPNIEVNGDFEGFGMVLVEAQACGRPVIAGRSGGTGETLRDRETGRLVDCRDATALADAAAELLADDAARRRMGEAGRRWVERQFDWPALARQSRAIFTERFGQAGWRDAQAA
jgi:phosphatidylinositol alpha-1,6-mannosyltransferase